jgi:hypothetical protein
MQMQEDSDWFSEGEQGEGRWSRGQKDGAHLVPRLGDDWLTTDQGTLCCPLCRFTGPWDTTWCAALTDGSMWLVKRRQSCCPFVRKTSTSHVESPEVRSPRC